MFYFIIYIYNEIIYRNKTVIIELISKSSSNNNLSLSNSILLYKIMILCGGCIVNAVIFCILNLLLLFLCLNQQ